MISVAGLSTSGLVRVRVRIGHHAHDHLHGRFLGTDVPIRARLADVIVVETDGLVPAEHLFKALPGCLVLICQDRVPRVIRRGAPALPLEGSASPLFLGAVHHASLISGQGSDLPEAILDGFRVSCRGPREAVVSFAQPDLRALCTWTVLE